MARYRKKPVEIDAMQLTADNAKDVCDWVQSHMVLNGQTGGPGYDHTGRVYIRTLEGEMTASVGDWIIRGVQGEHYPCKPDIFAQTYEAVDQ